MNTQEKTDSALDMFQLLEEDDRKNGVLKDMDLSRHSRSVLKFYTDLSNKAQRNDSNARKFKEGTNILKHLLSRYNELYNLIKNYENKAIYFQMKYEGVKDLEEVQDKMMNSISILMNQNDELTNKLKQYEN